MKLMTAELQEKIPGPGETDGRDPKEIMVYVKFFNPSGAGTWYATEYDPEERMFFGYVTGLGYNELGYFSLTELEEVRTPFGLGIERDLYWKPKSLAEVMEKEPPG